MLATVNSAGIRSYVSQLSTAYQTRYYLSLNAREPATWIRSQFASWLGEAQSKFVENGFNQPNVIGRIEAKSGGPNAPIVILGAHLDSTSQTPMESAPGADDDSSGVATIMAIMRILKANNYQGTYAIEAHAYAGEEGGLLGSMGLANQYKLENKSIRGILDFEMIAVLHPAVRWINNRYSTAASDSSSANSGEADSQLKERRRDANGEPKKVSRLTLRGKTEARSGGSAGHGALFRLAFVSFVEMSDSAIRT